jgi:7-cyano-7-deazaguanine synthase
MNPAIVLLSGGLDSTTALAIAKEMGFIPLALTCLYGQKNQVELLSAKKVVEDLKVIEHKIINLDLRVFGGSSLTDESLVKKHEDQKKDCIPDTYVPARNTIMLSLALAFAEVRNAYDIFFGANIHDYSGYPDCRPAYIKAFQEMANLATKNAELGHTVKIHAPLVDLSKAEIIKTGVRLGIKYEHTHSCYDPIGELACGKCSACYYRKKGFKDARIDDPTRYA